MWNCTLTSIADAADFAERVPIEVIQDCSNQFLPQLQEFDAEGTCLGYWSRLFSECHRPSLIKLKLLCSHLGLPSMSQFNLSDAPNLWPNLKELGSSLLVLTLKVLPRYYHTEVIQSIYFDDRRLNCRISRLSLRSLPTETPATQAGNFYC